MLLGDDFMSKLDCRSVDAPRVIFVQPTVPNYRVGFFRDLALFHPAPIEVLCSEHSPGSPGTVSAVAEYSVRSMHETKSLLKGRLFWQKGLRIPEEYGSGDVLVLNGNPRFLSNYPLWIRAKCRKMGVIWWGHGHTAGTPEWMDRIRRKIMQFADTIVLYTDKERLEYQRLGLDSCHLFAANNTIDTGHVKRAIAAWSRDELDAFRDEHGLWDSRVALFCGRIEEKACLDLLFKALKSVLQTESSWILVIIGQGSRAEELSSEAEKIGIAERVKWVGACYDEYKLAPWFLSAFCFVYPGAIGLSLLHAFAYGLPVITHNNRDNHMPEFAALEEGKNGLIYDEGCSESLADTLKKIGGQPEFRNKLAANAARTMEEEYTLSAMVCRFSGAIENASRKALSKRDNEKYNLR